MRNVIGVVVAVVLANCAPPVARHDTHWIYKSVKTEITPEHRVRLSDLVGLSPAAVQQKLTGQTDGWPSPMGLEISSPAGTLAFANLGEWMSDDAGHEIGTRGADNADFNPAAFSHCDPRFADAKDAPVADGVSLENGRVSRVLIKDTSAWAVALEFRNGRFVQAWSAPSEPRTQRATTLEDGASFTSKWGREPLGANVALTIQCWRSTPVRQLAPGAGPPADLAGDLQGLALLPFEVQLPSLNARRVTAMHDGTAVYNRLAPGAEVPGGVEAFAAKHPVIVIRRSSDPHYVLLQIDLGAYPSRNLTYFHHEALIGVRDGRVLFRTHRGEAAIWGLGAERELPASDEGSGRRLLVG
ncbi:MAG: hypothetical protein ACRED8_04550 [Caulobacteraceae bacterium]